MNFEHSPRALEILEQVDAFLKVHVEPVEVAFWEDVRSRCSGGDWKSWSVPPLLEELKSKAKDAGLWNLFLPDPKLGAGLSTLDYAPIAERTGHSLLAPTVFNCNAPDSGNMELLWRFGSDSQKQAWLKPLLAGSIRSVFCMTEPDVASSDATNMQATATVEGDEIVLNGRKWWSSGAGDPHARIAIFMGLTADPAKDRHHQHSMVLVPLDTKGVTVERMLPVFGDFDPPHGHGEMVFDNVRLPLDHFIGGPGQGFDIAQARLGPGRIHHCMRCIGAAEEALSLTLARASKRVAFGKPIVELGGNRERIAEARIAIDQARLLTLHAAWKIDQVGVRSAMTEISAIKVAAPRVLQQVVDMAIQMHGGAGLSQDTPLPPFFAQARALRLADGPDEVHLAMIAKLELSKHQ